MLIVEAQAPVTAQKKEFMPTIISVRQNEIVVVGKSRMAEVSSMFTLGMNPCIGLVLWSEEMCALGHFQEWDTIAQCGPVVKHFCKISSPGLRKAVIVMATVTKDNLKFKSAWHSEAMKHDLDKLIPLAYQVVKPAETANVKIRLY